MILIVLLTFISKVSLITAIDSKYLIVHGKGQSPSIITLENNELSNQNLFQNNKEITL